MSCKTPKPAFALFVLTMLCWSCDAALAQVAAPSKLEAKFLPDQNRKLLFLGQDLGSVGGVEGHSNGYFENVSNRVGGVTTYTNLPSLSGLNSAADWGAGDIDARKIVASKHFRKSALAIGLYLVDQLESINSGQHDAAIDRLADWIVAAKRPVFLRIGYEFDGYWNHYEPEAYQLAFRRIVDRFRARKISNCAYVWQAGTSPVDDAVEKIHEDITDWYPGDDYVDWCGLSWFEDSKKQVELSDELLNFARKHRKPVMICESACQRYDLAKGTKRFFNAMMDGEPGKGLEKKTPEQIWEEWFVPYFQFIEKNKDVIRAVAYINANWDRQPKWGPPYNEGYWGDSRVEANDLIRKKWLSEISKPSWIHQSELK